MFIASSKLPSGTFKEEASDIGSLSSKLREVFLREAVLNLSLQADVVKGKAFSTSGNLHNSRKVGHGIKEA